MDSIIASLAATIGVVLGSVLTYLFQARNARQAQELARDQQFWQERLAAYSEFAGIVTDFRRGENDRWHREQEDPQGAPFISGRDDSYQLRAKATAAMCRVQFIGGDTALSQLAERALNATIEIHMATDGNDRTRRGEKARLGLQKLPDGRYRSCPVSRAAHSSAASRVMQPARLAGGSACGAARGLPAEAPAAARSWSSPGAG